MNKDRLKVLAIWLKTQNIFYDERDGAMESAIKYAKEDVCRTIGDYITEIIAMNDEQIKNELNGEKE